MKPDKADSIVEARDKGLVRWFVRTWKWHLAIALSFTLLSLVLR